MRRAAFSMIGAARQRGCTVIACGADASDHAADYLAHGADFILLGEGEITLGELLDSLSGRSAAAPRSDPEPGFYSEKGEPESLIKTTRRPEIKDLDSLPFPAWDLVDVPRYKRDLAASATGTSR